MSDLGISMHGSKLCSAAFRDVRLRQVRLLQREGQMASSQRPDEVCVVRHRQKEVVTRVSSSSILFQDRRGAFFFAKATSSAKTVGDKPAAGSRVSRTLS